MYAEKVFSSPLFFPSLSFWESVTINRYVVIFCMCTLDYSAKLFLQFHFAFHFSFLKSRLEQADKIFELNLRLWMDWKYDEVFFFILNSIPIICLLSTYEMQGSVLRCCGRQKEKLDLKLVKWSQISISYH